MLVLKRRQPVERPRATPPPAQAAATERLNREDVHFLEAMRELGVRRQPRPGQTPTGPRTLQPVEFLIEAEDQARFLRRMATLGVTAATGRASPGPLECSSSAMEGTEDREADFSNTDPEAPAPRSGPVGAGARAAEWEDPEDTLDLHGTDRLEAIHHVHRFLRGCQERRLRTALIITGRGRNSEEQGPVLRQAVYRWLAQNGRRYVADFWQAPSRHGGEGAIWIVLNQHQPFQQGSPQRPKAEP